MIRFCHKGFTHWKFPPMQYIHRCFVIQATMHYLMYNTSFQIQTCSYLMWSVTADFYSKKPVRMAKSMAVTLHNCHVRSCASKWWFPLDYTSLISTIIMMLYLKWKVKLLKEQPCVCIFFRTADSCYKDTYIHWLWSPSPSVTCLTAIQKSKGLTKNCTCMTSVKTCL